MSGLGIVDRLARSTVVLDAGMGAALLDRGLAVGRCPETWNVERPDAVREIHASHLEAGSDVVQTNTFGANAIRLAGYALASEVRPLNLAAARIAREAAEAAGGRLVAGNIGPSGAFLPPVGDASHAVLEEAFAEQAAALEAGGVDYLAIETMTDLNEALLALQGAKKASSLPITVCLSFEKRPRGFFTMMGQKPGASARVLADNGACAVGANCSIGSGMLVELCPEFASGCDLPIIVKPNAGLPEMVEGRAAYRQDPEAFGRDVAAAVEAGARAVGGCCGTDHRHIAAIVSALAAT